MTIAFITLSNIENISVPGIYTDLVREFIKNGHDVYVIKPNERRTGRPTELLHDGHFHLLGVKTLNIVKTNIVEKGLGTILIEHQFTKAVEKFLPDVKFDLILYSTPPITFVNTIKYLKRKTGAKTYLMLKDIFPQNAVDLGMFSEHGLMYKWFRNKEKKLYEVSDYIGCMSPANVEYVLKHNPEIPSAKVEICPNAMEIVPQEDIDINSIRAKYRLPLDRRIFIYGGNLGKPQGVDFLLDALRANIDRTDRYFLIVGAGTDAGKISDWVNANNPSNVRYISALPRTEYDNLIRACDVGLIFLDHRFTIPNFPSRLLSYLNNKMPIIVASDPNTDIGKIAKENGFGEMSLSNDLNGFNVLLDKYSQMQLSELKAEGQLGYDYLKNNYDVKDVCKVLESRV